MTDKPEQTIVVVCARITTPLYMPDYRIGRCHECGWRVQFSPDAPRGRRLCMECAMPAIEDGAEVRVTPQTIERFKNYQRKKRQ
jgi:hypothetical protein